MIRRRQHQHGVHGKWTSNQRKGSIQAAPAVTPAPSFTNTYSLDFDGSDDEMIGDADTTNDSPLNDLSGAATISIWAKLGDQSGTVFWVANQNLVVGGKPFANRYFWIQARADTNKVLYHVATSAATVNEWADSETLGNGNWVHYAITWDGSTATYYLNGSSQGTDSVGGTLDDQAGKPIRHIEVSRKGYYSDKVIAQIDEAAIWNTALSADDITAIYNSGAPNDLAVAGSYDTDRTSNLIGWWRCGDGTEDASGSTVYDMSGQDNTTNLTLNNMADADYEEDVPS